MPSFIIFPYPQINVELKIDGHVDLLVSPRKIVLNGATQAPHPFGIAVFENHVFFTDWAKMGVIRTNRFNGSNPSLIYRTANQPGHVVVSHPVLQPVGKEMHLQPLTSQVKFSVQRCHSVSRIHVVLHEHCTCFVFGFF